MYPCPVRFVIALVMNRLKPHVWHGVAKASEGARATVIRKRVTVANNHRGLNACPHNIAVKKRQRRYCASTLKPCIARGKGARYARAGAQGPGCAMDLKRRKIVKD